MVIVDKLVEDLKKVLSLIPGLGVRIKIPEVEYMGVKVKDVSIEFFINKEA